MKKMNAVVRAAVAATSLLLLPVLTGAMTCSHMVAQSDEDLARARGVADLHVLTNETLERLVVDLEQAASKCRMLTERTAVVAAQVQAVLHGGGTDSSGTGSGVTDNSARLGRWISTQPQAVLAWMAWPEPRFTAAVLGEVGAQLETARTTVSEWATIEEPARTGKAEAESRIRTTLNQVSQAAEELARTEAFLSRWEVEWESLSGEQKALVPATAPTLSEAMKARLGRLLAEAHAKERELVEAEERQMATERAEDVALDKRALFQLQSRQRRDMAKFTQTVLEAQFQVDVEAVVNQTVAAEATASRMAAARKEREATLALELAKAQAIVTQLEAEVRRITLIPGIREAVPPEVFGRIALLSAPGFWRPHFQGCSLASNARYDTVEPIPHSYASLVAAGCLDETPAGVFALWMVMGNMYDKDRPRMSVSGWPVGYRWSEDDPLRCFQANQDAYKTLKAVQSALRTYGEDLVAIGKLSK